MSRLFTLETLGEDALLLRLGNSLDEELNDRVHDMAGQIRLHTRPWLRDIVPAFSSLVLCIDPLAFAEGVDPMQAVSDWLDTLPLDELRAGSARVPREHEIHVRYGNEHGPDLEAVADHAGLDPAEVVLRHTAPTYRVGMLGFAAGFPYLLGMDARLAMPRRATPRTAVAAGSIGIGGTQTGIYPRRGPGGWQIIGRTDFTLFDHTHDPPATVGPGDFIRFVDITANDRGSR